MIQVSIYGRIGKTPKAMQTKTGKPMTTASVAVDVGKSPEEGQTLWITLMAFERHAEALEKHQPGDCIGAMGKLTRSHYTGNDGQERESWSLLVDALHSSRTVRPNGGKRQEARNNGQRQTTGTDTAPFDDPLGF
jgi:single-strand DNA-binding protein